MNKGTEERIIPVKNYVILLIMFVAVVVLVFYLCNLYHVYDAHQRKVPVIRDTLSEIQPDELEHYVMETPSTAIYMCTAENEICRDYEKGFKKLIEKEDLQDSIIYLNLSNIDLNQFVDKFNAKYPYKVEITKNYPALVIFEDGEICAMLQGTNKQKLTLTQTEQFIEMNQIKRQGEGE